MGKHWKAAGLVFWLIISAAHGLASDSHRFSHLWPTLEQPWYFSYPNDVAVDSREYLYVADTNNGRIAKFTADGFFVTAWNGSESGPSSLQKPHGIAIDADDRIYVADRLSSYIQIFTPDGEFERRWRCVDDNGNDFLPSGIAMDPLGYVYITQPQAHCIRVFTDQGRYIGAFDGSENRGERLEFPQDLAVNKAGELYVTDPETDRIRGFGISVTAAQLTVTDLSQWGTRGSEPSRFNSPYGIACHRDQIFVVDMNNSRVQVFDPQGRFIRRFGEPGDEKGRFSAPTGIGISPKGRVYVAGKNLNRIQKFSNEGTFLSAWQSMETQAGAMQRPRGIAADADGKLFVADKNNHRIQVFAPNGRYLRAWGEKGTAEGQFDLPFGVAVYEDRVYVADTQNHRIQTFNRDGDFIAAWGSRGSGPGEFYAPMAIATDGQGNLYVADSKNHRIQKFDPGGDFIMAWGEIGQKTGQFYEPRGITVSGDSVFVSDLSSRVQKFSLQGAPAEDWRIQDTDHGRFSMPVGLATDGEYLYVTDSQSHRIQIFDLNGEWIETIGKKGSQPGLFNMPADLAIYGKWLYVTDSANHRVQAFESIVEARGITKAILVAGGGAYDGNAIWDITRTCTHSAYRALRYRGLSPEALCFLTPDPEIYFGGAPQASNGAPTARNLEAAITDWATDADKLLIYLTDHGKRERFRLTPQETLSASQLDRWLDTLQETHDCRVVLVYDACNSGSFVSQLKPTETQGRVIMTSTGAGEDAYFISQGGLSFSGIFWTGLFYGKSLLESFEAAEATLSAGNFQTPQLEADGNGIANQSADRELLAQSPVFSRVQESQAIPIHSVEPEKEPPNRLRITAMLSPDQAVSRVWAVIRPPDFGAGAVHRSIIDLPTVELLPMGLGQYTGRYHSQISPGEYAITVFAKNQQDISLPKITRFSLGGGLRHRAVLVAGHSNNEKTQAMVEQNIQQAFAALRFQGYSTDDIRVLAEETFFQGVDGQATAENLRYALTDWAGSQSADLLVYLSGERGDGGFRLNASQPLKPETLDGWLDDLQSGFSGTVALIQDFTKAATFIPKLVPPEGKKRITIAGTGPDSGDDSFCAGLWRGVFKGLPLGKAFESAKVMLGLAKDGSDIRSPCLDDSANGIANEREDGQLARDFVLGAGIKTADDQPMVDRIVPDITIDGEQSVSLWADEVVSAARSVQKVWAVVDFPRRQGEMGSASGGTRQVEMVADPQTGRYRAQFSDFPYFGTYRVRIYARDADGNRSAPQKTAIYQRQGPDVYEPDNTVSHANSVAVAVTATQARSHCLHDAEDQDWLRFFALEDAVYTIQANFPDSGFPLKMALLDENQTRLAEKQGDEGELAIHWRADFSGTCFVKLIHADPESADPELSHAYDIRVMQPTAIFLGFALGTVRDAGTGQVVSGAVIQLDAGDNQARGSDISRADGGFLLFQAPGVYAVQVEAKGYKPFSGQLQVSELGTTLLDFSLEKKPSPSPPPPPPPPDTLPKAAILSPPENTEILPGQSLYFEATVSGGDAPLSYFWDFDGLRDKAERLNPGEVFFDRPGEYTITFTARDSQGDMDKDSVTVTVLSPSAPDSEPGADTAPEVTDILIFPTEILAGQTVRFRPEIEGGDPPFAYLWEFGEDTPASELAEPEIAFNASGERSVTLTVTDSDGDWDRHELSFFVNPVREETPVQARILSPSADTVLSQGKAVEFQGAVTGGAEPFAYLWDFDGAAADSTKKSPGQLPFDSPGTYRVTFTVTDKDGEQSQDQVQIAVRPKFEPPELLFPLDGAKGVSLSPVLQTGPFESLDPESLHFKTCWIVGADPEFSHKVLRICTQDPRFLTRLPVPLMALAPQTAYYWRAGFYDSKHSPSQASAIAGFTTDRADNGEALISPLPLFAQSLDLDRDGRPDGEQPRMKMVRAAGADGWISVKARTNVTAIEALRSLKPSQIQADAPADGFPLGLIGFRLNTEHAGETAEISVYWAQPLPEDSRWIFHDPISCQEEEAGAGFSDNVHEPLSDWKEGTDIAGFSDNATQARLKITDGARGDADHTANGVIVHIGSIASPGARQFLIPAPPSAGSVDGAGCFIRSAIPLPNRAPK